MWPWAAISFPSNLYSSATASNPGQQLLHTTSKWRVGPWHLISACRRGEQSGELRRWKQRHREVKGQYREREYWMPNVISFISAHVSALSDGIDSQGFSRNSLWSRHHSCDLCTPAVSFTEWSELYTESSIITMQSPDAFILIYGGEVCTSLEEHNTHQDCLVSSVIHMIKDFPCYILVVIFLQQQIRSIPIFL